eukprot:370364_1
MSSKRKYDEIDVQQSERPSKKQKINDNSYRKASAFEPNHELLNKIYEKVQSQSLDHEDEDKEVMSEQDELDNALFILANHLNCDNVSYNTARVSPLHVSLYGNQCNFSIRLRKEIWYQPKVSLVNVFAILREYNVRLEAFTVWMYSCNFMTDLGHAASYILRGNNEIKELDLVKMQYANQVGFDQDIFNRICDDIAQQSDLYCLSTFKIGGNLDTQMIVKFCKVILRNPCLRDIKLLLMMREDEYPFADGDLMCQFSSALIRTLIISTNYIQNCVDVMDECLTQHKISEESAHLIMEYCYDLDCDIHLEFASQANIWLGRPVKMYLNDLFPELQHNKVKRRLYFTDSFLS